MPKTRIFLSAVSGQFRECRNALASDLRAIGCEVRVQEDFQQGPRSLLEKLEEYIAGCDRVIALVGDAYGFEASGDALPVLDVPRSYTQWEYAFAMGERLIGGAVAPKQIYAYLATPGYIRTHSVEQLPRDAERQGAFVERLKASGKHWSSFDTVDELCRRVLRDGWQRGERPRKPNNLPYASIGALFKGREADLKTLHDRLWRAGGLDARVAVHGLGGVGKTRLAVEYAKRWADEYSALLFVSGDTPDTLRAALAALCGALTLDLLEQKEKEEEKQVKAAFRWLDEHPGWLLILDSVDTKEAASTVEQILSRLEGGHLLITTRLSNWSAAIKGLELTELSEDASADFLVERTRGRRQETVTDDTDIRTLALELGGLALALEQAGAFVSTLRVSFAVYLRRWRAREPKVRQWHNATVMKYPLGLAVTWDTTVAQLDPAAYALLCLLSWVGPEPVPSTLLETARAAWVLGVGVTRLRGTTDSGEHGDFANVEEALATLSAFSLVRWDGGNHAFRVHRLVQEAARDRQAGQHREWLTDVTSLLNGYLPADTPSFDTRSWSLWEPIRPHVAAVIGSAEEVGIGSAASRLMNDFAVYLYAKAVWHEAEPLMRRVLKIDEASYGTDHPNVASRLNNLAQLLQDTNRLADAEPLMRRALKIDEASYGADHPKVATRLNNLAQLLQATNRLSEAEPLMRRALKIDEASYGAEHPEVAIELNNLAGLFRATNRLAEAEPLLRHALRIHEASYGADHPTVATSLNNLAELLQATNRLAEAEPLKRRALRIDEASYGENHPKVAKRLSNLAILLLATDRPSEAEPLMRRALEIDGASYGPEHPEVAVKLSNLAQLLKATNRLSEAEPLMDRALKIDEASYGPDHPHVARDLNNLAQLLQATNRPSEAEPLMRRALKIDEASYGAEHPDVAVDLNNLAGLLKATNRLSEAEVVMRRAVEILLTFTQATRHEHPHLEVAIASYADLLAQMDHSERDIQVRLRAMSAAASRRQ